MITRGKGCRRDVKDPRDHEFKFKAARVHVPAEVDLRKWMPPILDQGEIGSCVSHSITSALRWHLRRAGAAYDPLSRLQVYYYARYLEKTILEDAGCEIRNGIKSVQKFGAAKEDLWPYIENKFTIEPPDEVKRLGMLWTSLTYERVPVGVNSLKVALAEGFPVVIGISLFDSFESGDVEKTGIVPFPDIENESMTGGHAMLCVGYGQKPGYFTVANSWSEEWGDKGYCYIPEKYIGSPKFGSDYWIIKNLGGA